MAKGSVSTGVVCRLGSPSGAAGFFETQPHMFRRVNLAHRSSHGQELLQDGLGQEFSYGRVGHKFFSWFQASVRKTRTRDKCA